MRYVRAIYALTLALLLVPQALRSDQAQPTPSANLADLFAPGGLLQERNGDGVIDYVNARIVLGPAASASDVSAASDIAARLGFETSAMDIPLSGGPGRTTIAIGPAGLPARSISACTARPRSTTPRTPRRIVSGTASRSACVRTPTPEAECGACSTTRSAARRRRTHCISRRGSHSESGAPRGSNRGAARRSRELTRGARQPSSAA